MSVSLSTHVLDTAEGLPAAGVRIELLLEGELVSWGETNADGRVSELGIDLVPGLYELVFHPPSRFFHRVAYQILLDDGHYHVPLLVSPFGCASYRGS